MTALADAGARRCCHSAALQCPRNRAVRGNTQARIAPPLLVPLRFTLTFKKLALRFPRPSPLPCPLPPTQAVHRCS